LSRDIWRLTAMPGLLGHGTTKNDRTRWVMNSITERKAEAGKAVGKGKVVRDRFIEAPGPLVQIARQAAISEDHSNRFSDWSLVTEK
jgi:hypothetical protein